ncbi:hypothetical protein MTR_2g099600 [Medicago truncatula]|uniref:Uncharacterized protein n=1 Tax=Medicago truncatula TaxID=3880 RepID=G7IS31_MEDTR|nr:hypothetical protein MTR_2g099600 [Medicago truncatula]
MGNQKWTSETEEALQKGVKKYGVGKWADILKDPEINMAEFNFQGQIICSLSCCFFGQCNAASSHVVPVLALVNATLQSVTTAEQNQAQILF